MGFGRIAHFVDLLKDEITRAEEKFDAEFDEKGISWRSNDEDFQFDRMMEEVKELEEAIAVPYGPEEDGSYRAYRLNQMRSEFIDVANCALMGADWCTQSVKKIKKEERAKE